ncbi:acyltransferase [Yersinia mollaretii]|uniref:acyltransferase family protein n=1 Tax=Yersinia mollaretii TaxID=33060 RepID=UPI001427C032|nr:acyltransferase [Yersinia mollaretii]MDA5534619.1 acyltransferase [Yersinia mollaretii]NIL02539.1 acyltransferase [Yersinia mollaretii]
MIADSNATRITHIDGIRGAASLAVVASHFFWQVLGTVVPEIRNPISAFFMNGGCAVIIFFILSGDSLSISFFKNRDEKKLLPIFLKRHLRLSFIILIISLAVMASMKLGLTYNKEAAAVLSSETWLGEFLNFEAGLSNAITFAISNVYVGIGNNYNPFFWTMSFELLGSFFVILFCYSYNNIKNPDLIAAVCYTIFAIAGSYLALFFIGMLFAKFRQDGFFDRMEKRMGFIYNSILIIIVALLISFIATQAYLYNRTILARLYFFLCPIMIALVYSNSGLKKFFSSPALLFLGRVSYPLYAVHFVVITTFFSYIVATYPLDRHGFLILSTVSVLVSLVLAYLLELIERVYLRGLNKQVLKIIK